jgi:hypothetical protein
MNKAFTSLAVVIVIVAIISVALHFSGVPEAINTTIMGGIFGLYPAVSTALAEQKKTKQERIAEFVKGNFYIHPVLVTFYILCYLQFLERTFGALFGGAMGAAVGLELAISGAQGPDIASTVSKIVPMLVPLFVTLFSVFAIIPIAKYATHRIKKFPFLWIVAAIIIDQTISIAVAALLLNATITINNVLGQYLISLLLFPGAIIGYFWARKTHTAYIMSHLFKQLPQPDQTSLIDLVETLPGASTAQ